MKRSGPKPRSRAVRLTHRATRAKVVRRVHVPGEKKPRRVFYVLRPFLVDKNGRPCPTALELGVRLADALGRRDAEAVAGYCWDALNFVHNGRVPKNWLGGWRKAGPTPLAV